MPLLSQPVFPAEIFGLIFGLARTPADIAVCLGVSRWFYAEFKKVQMSKLRLDRPDHVESLIMAQRGDEGRHRVKELSFSLKVFDENFLTQRTIFPMLGIFSNLTVLTIAGGRVTDHIHSSSVTRLPHLRELRLIECGIYVFSRSDHPEGDRPFTVRFLVLDDVRVFQRHPGRADEISTTSTSAMHDAQLTIFPPALLAGLISLEFHPRTYIQPLYWLLPDTPALKHIIVRNCVSIIPLPRLPFPLLSTLRGPPCIAVGAISSASGITELCISDYLTPVQALVILDDVHPDEIFNLELALTQWEPSVLESISLRFNKCKRLKVAFLGPGPTEANARAIGREQLCRMPRLDTFLLCGQALSNDTTRNIASAYEFLASVSNNPLLEVVAIHGRALTRDATVNLWTSLDYHPTIPIAKFPLIAPLLRDGTILRDFIATLAVSISRIVERGWIENPKESTDRVLLAKDRGISGGRGAVETLPASELGTSLQILGPGCGPPAAALMENLLFWSATPRIPNRKLFEAPASFVPFFISTFTSIPSTHQLIRGEPLIVIVHRTIFKLCSLSVPCGGFQKVGELPAVQNIEAGSGLGKGSAKVEGRRVVLLDQASQPGFKTEVPKTEVSKYWAKKQSCSMAEIIGQTKGQDVLKFNRKPSPASVY
ncbi:hypothetical protein B0H14DRAFT_2607103 [Mycena olivaceomarginata]|nr:hypothetical protein B0H14DRAFT_2607103 [Mycena olivaceomarginata]